MTIIDGLILFFSIIISYSIIVYILHKKGILKKYNISFYGPGLLLRSSKGVNFLKRIANKKRFWKAFGSSGIVVCFIFMILLTIVLIFQSFLLFEFTSEQKELIPGPEAVLPFPGLNPILPFEYVFYIILALVIAIVVHEFSHGILSIVGKIKVKSLGMVLMIIPLGAFTEPDEEELKNTEIPKRMRVYAAGPLSNFLVAFICILLFSFVFMSAVQPIEGVDIFYVLEGTPAESIGLSKGSVITSINDSEIKSYKDFSSTMANISTNQTVNITYMVQKEIITTQVQLMNEYEYYERNNYTNINESLRNESFLGIGINPYNKTYLLSSLKDPFFHEFPNGLLNLYALPFFGYIAYYNPIADPFTNSYIITGPLSFLPPAVFWGIVNALYWIFWISIALGIFNVLPMIPLDGGFLFNDAIKVLVKKIKKDLPDEKKDKIAKKVATFSSLVILIMIILPFLIKYI